MTKMTDREKKLVYFTSILCIVVLGFKFLLEPTILALQERNANLGELTTQVETYELQIAQLNSIQQSYENNQVTLEDLKDNYGSYLEDEDVQRLFTDLIEDNGLSVELLTIEQDVSNYLDDKITHLTAKGVSFSAYGSIENMIKLLDACNQRSDILVTNSVFDCDNAYDPFGNSQDGVYQIDAVVYMSPRGD